MRRIAPQVAASIGVALLVVAAPAETRGQDGFLFSRPVGQVTVKAGPHLPRAHGLLFDDLRTRLTLERGDFRAPALAADLAILAGNRLDVVLGVGWAESDAGSEFRELIGDDGEPILQTTRLRTMPVTVTARYHPLPRGRTVGTLAWLPTTTMPYVGGGAGITWYRLQQEGEFVDYRDNAIFESVWESRGRGQTVHAVAGVDHWFTPRVGLNVEGRYTRGSAPLTGDFRELDRMDLTGFQATVGLSYRW
jgi:hypothetical protein